MAVGIEFTVIVTTFEILKQDLRLNVLCRIRLNDVVSVNAGG